MGNINDPKDDISMMAVLMSLVIRLSIVSIECPVVSTAL